MTASHGGIISFIKETEMKTEFCWHQRIKRRFAEQNFLKRWGGNQDAKLSSLKYYKYYIVGLRIANKKFEILSRHTAHISKLNSH